MRYILAVITLLLCGCGYAKHNDPIMHYDEPSNATALHDARIYAESIGGDYHQNQCCGSMEPLIHAGDWVVTNKTEFSDALLGKVVDYQPQWHPQGPVEHRLVSGNAKDGFIASGDNNATSEASERVTATNYIGEVIAIYRAP